MIDSAIQIAVIVFLAATVVSWLVIVSFRRASLQYHSSFIAAARFNLESLYLFIDPRRLFHLNVAGLLLLPIAVWIFTGNGMFAILTTVALITLPQRLYQWLRDRRTRRFEEQLPDAVMMIAGALRAGASLQGAISSTVAEQKPPLSQEFELMLREHRLGVVFDHALQNMSNRMPSQDFGLVLSAIRISNEVGGGLSEALERLAETLRAKAVVEGKIRALTAQGKLQGIVVGALPIVIIFILFRLEPEGMEPLLTTYLGWAVLGLVAFLEYIGVKWIRRIMAIDV